MVGRDAVNLDAKFFESPCATVTVSSLGGQYAGPPIFKASPPDEFDSLTFLEHLKVEGCGHARAANTLVFRLKSGGWRAVSLLDGDSHASPRLEIDAITTAKGLLLAGTTCDAAHAGSTLHMGQVRILQDSIQRGPWTELWPATVCGKPVAVAVVFTPDATGGGTSFNVHRDDAAAGQDGVALKPN
jgi:hypothetical protein